MEGFSFGFSTFLENVSLYRINDPFLVPLWSGFGFPSMGTMVELLESPLFCNISLLPTGILYAFLYPLIREQE